LHHPVEHELSVVRTLLTRSQQLVTVSQNKIQEYADVEEALWACGYPPWSVSKVRRQMESKGDERKKTNKKQEVSVKRPMIVTPHVEKVSEAIVRIMKKHNAPVAMKPWNTLKGLLVYVNHKQNKEDITECVYKVPCPNCDKTCGETERKIGVRLYEHKMEVESRPNELLPQVTNRLEKGYSHRQRTTPSYQVDQGSCTYPYGRSLSYVSRRAQLSVESRLRPLS